MITTSWIDLTSYHFLYFAKNLNKITEAYTSIRCHLRLREFRPNLLDRISDEVIGGSLLNIKGTQAFLFHI